MQIGEFAIVWEKKYTTSQILLDYMSTLSHNQIF